MTELNVPRPHGPAFCAEFSRKHHAWRVTLPRTPAPKLEADPAATLAAAEHLTGEDPFQTLEYSEHEPRFDITVRVGGGEGRGRECRTSSPCATSARAMLTGACAWTLPPV